MVKKVKLECVEVIERCFVECLNHGIVHTTNVRLNIRNILWNKPFSSLVCGEII